MDCALAPTIRPGSKRHPHVHVIPFPFPHIFVHSVSYSPQPYICRWVGSEITNDLRAEKRTLSSLPNIGWSLGALGLILGLCLPSASLVTGWGHSGVPAHCTVWCAPCFNAQHSSAAYMGVHTTMFV